MKLRILSKTGDALAVSDRFNADLETQWDTPPEKDTLIIFDQAGLGNVAETLKKNHFVFGAGKINDALELNPVFGRQIAENAGIKTGDAKGQVMTIDAFYKEGERVGLMLSSINREGNSFCRIWKNKEPRIYRHTLMLVERLLKPFKYSGPLSCECIIEDKHKMPTFVRWITHLQPHILWAVGPFLSVVVGAEMLNGHPVPYHWIGVMKLSSQPCYVSAEHQTADGVKTQLEKVYPWISVPGKNVIDNLDEIVSEIKELLRKKYL